MYTDWVHRLAAHEVRCFDDSGNMLADNQSAGFDAYFHKSEAGGLRMILTVDIGNTNVVVGGFASQQEPVIARRLPSRRDWTRRDWQKELKGLLLASGGRENVEGTVLSSVVPELTALICPVLQELTGYPVMTVDSELDDGLVLVGYDRKTLGNDRVVDAVSALAQFSPPIVIFDLGTATTMSVLDVSGRFVGGMILPGMRMSLDALTNRTSQLPTVSIVPPKALLGTDAVSCMQSGVVFGTAAQIDGLSDRVEAMFGHPVTTVVTGGMSPLVLPHCRRKLQYDEHLLLKGLKILYDRERAACKGG